MVLTAPLDLQYWLVNTLSGSMIIFIILATVAIAALSARFRLNSMAFGLIIALFAVMMANFAQWFLFLIIVIGGFAAYFSLGRLLKA